jgi:transcriptional regulator with XRE-family HTH domain
MKHRTTPTGSTFAGSPDSDRPRARQDHVVPAPRAQSPDPTPGDDPPPGVTGPAPLVFSRSRLRAWRHLRGIDYAALADAAHITAAEVAAYEFGNGQPTTQAITSWAAVLGCEPDQLRSTTPEGPDEYWQAANQAMGPMSPEDLAVVADVIMRGHSRQSRPPNPYTDRL